MKRGTMLVVVLLVFAVLAGGTWALRARQGVATILPALPSRTDAARAPSGVRIRVEVVNTTRTRGLARRATRVLRDLGYDVVEMTTAGPLRDTTVVLDRSAHPEWAAAIAQALGPAARSESQPDTSRYLDVTVLLGRAWRPPAQPLDP